jgi:hypothetical protein
MNELIREINLIRFEPGVLLNAEFFFGVEVRLDRFAQNNLGQDISQTVRRLFRI